jgi:hypothetical protein
VEGLKWAESHDPAKVDQATKLWDWFDTDPEGAYEYLTGVMRRGGILKEPTRQSSNQPPAPHTDPRTGRPLPDIVIQETGQRFYSAEQADKLLDWQENRINQRIAPLEGERVRTQAHAEAQQMLQEASTWDGFDDNVQEIYALMGKDKRLSRDAVIAEMRGKATAGSGSINPGAAGPQSTEETRKLPLKELFKREMQKRGLGR